jgi:NAD(P)-dependent dehydrogenase (short-subunit alcohol dehydrogenase family)
MTETAVLVTGAARGIGLAIARRFIASGASVMIADREGEVARASAQAIGAEHYEIDLQQVDRIPQLIEHTVEKLGAVNVLVNNAGVEFGGGIFDVTQEVWDTHLNINLRAMFFATQAAARWMAANGGGAVVNIASIQGQIFTATFIPYTVSKAGVRGLTGALAVALAPHNIRVNAVAPGWTATSMNKVADDPNATEKRLQMIPLRRIGQPENIADTVFFLASQQAAYMTGQTVTVDGGRTLGAPPA